MTIKEIKPLIKYDKKNETWLVEAKLAKTLSILTEGRGILNYKLYHKVLKEYKKHRSVYDSTRGSTILSLRAISLASLCYGTRGPEVKGASYKYLSETVIKEHVIPWSEDSDFFTHYPQLPTQALPLFKDLLVKLFGYIQLPEDKSRSEMDRYNDWVIPGITGIVAHYYVNWPRYSEHPEEWFNLCMKAVQGQNYMPLHKAAIEKDIKEILKTYQDDGFTLYPIEKKKWYHYLKEAILGI